MSYEIKVFHWNGIPVLSVKGEGNVEEAVELLGQEVVFELQKQKLNFVFQFPQPMNFEPNEFCQHMAVAGVNQIIDAGGRVNLVVMWCDVPSLQQFSELCGVFEDMHNALEDLASNPKAGKKNPQPMF